MLLKLFHCSPKNSGNYSENKTSSLQNSPDMAKSLKKEILQILQDPRLGLNDPVDPEKVTNQIEQWLAIWEKWNNKISLTAEKDALTVVQQHFFGSLLYRQGLGKAQNLLDIGSGAGFPGIPLKLADPELNVTLVDSQRKRTGFLQEIVRVLQLPDVEIINDRVENLGQEHRRRYESVTFRYVDKVETCLALAEPFLKFDGRVIIIKEPEYQLPKGQGVLPLNCNAEIPVRTWSGADSKIMVFAGCFT